MRETHHSALELVDFVVVAAVKYRFNFQVLGVCFPLQYRLNLLITFP